MFNVFTAPVLDINAQAARMAQTERFGVAKYASVSDMDAEALAELRIGLNPPTVRFIITVYEFALPFGDHSEPFVTVNVESQSYSSLDVAKAMMREFVYWSESEANRNRFLKAELYRRSTFNDSDDGANNRTLEVQANFL